MLKVLAHQKEYWKLWESFKQVALHAISVGAKDFLELPRGRIYCKDKRFLRFFNNMGSLMLCLIAVCMARRLRLAVLPDDPLTDHGRSRV